MTGCVEGWKICLSPSSATDIEKDFCSWNDEPVFLFLYGFLRFVCCWLARCCRWCVVDASCLLLVLERGKADSSQFVFGRVWSHRGLVVEVIFDLFDCIPIGRIYAWSQLEESCWNTEFSTLCDNAIT